MSRSIPARASILGACGAMAVVALWLIPAKAQQRQPQIEEPGGIYGDSANQFRDPSFAGHQALMFVQADPPARRQHDRQKADLCPDGRRDQARPIGSLQEPPAPGQRPRVRVRRGIDAAEARTR